MYRLIEGLYYGLEIVNINIINIESLSIKHINQLTYIKDIDQMIDWQIIFEFNWHKFCFLKCALKSVCFAGQLYNIICILLCFVTFKCVSIFGFGCFAYLYCSIFSFQCVFLCYLCDKHIKIGITHIFRWLYHPWYSSHKWQCILFVLFVFVWLSIVCRFWLLCFWWFLSLCTHYIVYM